MAKVSNKNATKSFVMLIVTGVVLVAVTLCWFAINKNSSVEEIQRPVGNNASTKATLYVGKTVDGEIAITSDENNEKCLAKYEVAETVNDAVVLENMIPGAEYFYKAVFPECSEGHYITLDFTDVSDEGLADMISVCGKVTQINEVDPDFDYDTNDKNYADVKILNKLREGDIEVIKNFKVENEGKHAVYFSFRFSDKAALSTTNEDGTKNDDGYENKSVKITSVDANVSSTEN